jgi:hypothetical protein
LWLLNPATNNEIATAEDKTGIREARIIKEAI